MHRSIAALVAGLMLTAAPRTTYPLYAPRGPSFPLNTQAPRKDKGSRYVFDRKGTRTIAA